MMMVMQLHPARRASRLSRSREFIAAVLLSLSFIAYAPQSARAADEVEHYDARVQTYVPDVELKSSGVGFTWILLFMLLGVCVGVIFKDAKRSHLD